MKKCRVGIYKRKYEVELARPRVGEWEQKWGE
jgi:hypothetical protein